jgi:glycerol-3-phosphate cytidylyltransferase
LYNEKVVGFVCGAFDYCHAGHVLMMCEAKEQCDYLIVGLQTDPSIDRPDKTKPEQDMFERWLQLDSIKYIDKIMVYETEDNLRDYLLANKQTIDKRFVDESYRAKEFTGKSIRDIEVIYNSRKHDYSSSKIIDKK